MIFIQIASNGLSSESKKWLLYHKKDYIYIYKFISNFEATHGRHWSEKKWNEFRIEWIKSSIFNGKTNGEPFRTNSEHWKSAQKECLHHFPRYPDRARFIHFNGHSWARAKCKHYTVNFFHLVLWGWDYLEFDCDGVNGLSYIDKNGRWKKKYFHMNHDNGYMAYISRGSRKHENYII